MNLEEPPHLFPAHDGGFDGSDGGDGRSAGG